MTAPRLRFAPSPTGYLHIGGARTALFNWLWARKTGGALVLRIEDTDQARSTDASRAAILDSLTWLGLDWDEGPFTQTERLAIYAERAQHLIAAGKAYRCYCTKDELAAQRGAAQHFKYPGTCRDRTDQPDLPYTVRLKTDRSGSVTYLDKVFGEQVVPNVELQDFRLLREGGVPLYNFGVVVDDIAMGITLVARGRDHMVNTPQQILLYQAFGAPIPAFAHLPMMLAPSGEKLSKRHGAVSVTEYRDNGYSPDAVLDYLSRFGWSPGENEERLSRAQLVETFDWSDCSKADGRFDPRKFLAINHDHLQSPALTPDYAARVGSFVEQRGLPATGLDPALPLIRPRAQTFVQAADLLDPFLREPPVIDPAAAALLIPQVAPMLRGFHDALAASEWTAAALEGSVGIWLAGAGLTFRELGPVARAALMGRTASPSLFEVLVVLGRDTALARLVRATKD